MAFYHGGESRVLALYLMASLADTGQSNVARSIVSVVWLPPRARDRSTGWNDLSRMKICGEFCYVA